MNLKHTTSIAALTALLASPALADITAADVWANQQSLYGAYGGTLSGELSADGTVSPVLNLILPEGIGSLQISVGEISLTEERNGSVTITYPSPMTFSVAGGIAGEASFAADLIMTNDEYSSTATGEAGDINYETTATDVSIEFTNVSLDGDEDFAMTGNMTFDSIANVSRVTEGDLVTLTMESAIGASSTAYDFEVDNVTTKSTQTMQPVAVSGTATLPAGGSDLMNLSAALRNGLSFSSEATGEGNSSSQVTLVDGEQISSQETTAGPQTSTFSFDENGLVIDASASEISAKIDQTLIIPIAIEFAINAVTANYRLPVNAAEETQDFRIATSLQGITLGDSLWSLVDPAGQLPRDPAEVTFDITGLGTNGLDLLDFASLEKLTGVPPVQIDEATIENLTISAVGAEVSAQGAMTFDWTDFETFAGLPRPEGAITVNVNGANQLMDTLVAMGLIPEDQLLMPRMMMGMFATPVGEDQLESVVEVNEEGHLLANGQRLQ